MITACAVLECFVLKLVVQYRMCDKLVVYHLLTHPACIVVYHLLTHPACIVVYCLPLLYKTRSAPSVYHLKFYN